ncbi:hypothetical protein [Breoghania sp.]|uniref:hypothetical protein n=1 Tax=Breoghania sp. TaxID=2065378 RepID=UPI00262FABBE|nr:hypothetical protein [Breoghania sp.]MDJ0932463.1 hypothetical protein [Breoghania sp.]
MARKYAVWPTAAPLDLVLALPLAIVALAILGVLLGLGARPAPAELLAALREPETLFALRLSLTTLLISLVIAILFGVPSAYLLARRKWRGMALIDTLLDLPLVMPPLVANIGLLFVIGRNSPVPPLARLGAEAPVFSGRYRPGADIRGHHPRAEERKGGVWGGRSGLSGCCRHARAFVCPRSSFSVDLPLAAGGITAGIVLAWARALGEFGATLMVAGATRMHTETLPMALFLNIATGAGRRRSRSSAPYC